MSKAYKDPTADEAIFQIDRWEKRQQELEEKHGIKRGDVIQITQTSYASGDGKIITKKVKARVKALYPHVVELQLSNGLTRSPTYWELERLKAGGDTNGQEHPGSVHGCMCTDQRDRSRYSGTQKKKKSRSRFC
nr:hypothetical protein [uncultured Blautia sp.]